MLFFIQPTSRVNTKPKSANGCLVSICPTYRMSPSTLRVSLNSHLPLPTLDMLATGRCAELSTSGGLTLLILGWQRSMFSKRLGLFARITAASCWSVDSYRRWIVCLFESLKSGSVMDFFFLFSLFLFWSSLNCASCLPVSHVCLKSFLRLF